MNDDVIRASIIEAIKLQPCLYDCDVSVDVHKGVAMLTGHVRNYEGKIIAARIAERTRGVVSVKQNLEIRYPTALAMPSDYVMTF